MDAGTDRQFRQLINKDISETEERFGSLRMHYRGLLLVV
jgi:hypothetical protein